MFENLKPDLSLMDNCFLTKQLITYIGNKRKLLPYIHAVIKEIKKVTPLHTGVDLFSGSGSVARLLRIHCKHVIANDLENYSKTLNQCFLAKPSRALEAEIIATINRINSAAQKSETNGFISRNYAPKGEKVKPAERAFYTRSNANKIDFIRAEIENLDPELRPFILAPLLIEASIHTNTSGVFKGFHKKDGVGHFGGQGEDALGRILQNIYLETPNWWGKAGTHEVLQGDATEIVKTLKGDIIYLDPPYNQHPYGSNYFMLNVINDNDEPEIQDGISGIKKNWNRSAYNKKREATEALDKLIESIKTRFKWCILSYNDEGSIQPNKIRDILDKHGATTTRWDIDYAAYKGSRNLKNRKQRVTEFLWISRF